MASLSRSGRKHPNRSLVGEESFSEVGLPLYGVLGSWLGPGLLLPYPTAAPPCGRFGSALGCAEGRLRPPLVHAVCAQGIPRPPPSSRSLPATPPSGRHSQALLLPGPPPGAALREARTTGLSPCSAPRLVSGILLLKGFSLFRSEAGRGGYCLRLLLGASEVTLLHLGSGYLAS